MNKSVIISGIIVIFAIIIASVSISNLMNNTSTEDNPKMLAITQEWNRTATNMYQLCITTENLAELQGCVESIQTLKEDCRATRLSGTGFCLNTNFAEFDTTIDSKLLTAQKKVDELKTRISELQDKIDKLENVPSLFYVSQSQEEVITNYKQLMRACLRYSEDSIKFIDDNGIEKWYDAPIEISKIREDLGFCIGTINDVRQYCDVLEICSAIDKFDELQSKFH